jgi:Asp-tRNA(Asn)/Glu-tRNA(Gln) amidotransferase A subunit family amidase
MTAVEAATAIERGSLTCEALARACLERIELREPIVHAWTVVDRAKTLARARELDRTPRRSLLHGLPVAVKDIIATTDFPTRYGSTLYADHVPRADAACVAILLAAGAVIPGKTVTTEFAYFQPGPTANPANPSHTPGGSSSGSAAAVADDMVPLGLGTQTAGSLTRPAAYCDAARQDGSRSRKP